MTTNTTTEAPSTLRVTYAYDVEGRRFYAETLDDAWTAIHDARAHGFTATAARRVATFRTMTTEGR